MRALRAAIAASVLAIAGTASADEPAPARTTARRAIIEGDLPKARAILRDAPADAAGADRAANAELLFIVEEWSATGRPPAVTGANDAPAPDTEESWERAFSNGRNLLLVGRYAEAARRFDALVGSAPDLVAGARAAELRALARESAPAVQPAAPSTVPVAKPPPAADTPPPSSTEKAETESRWYGWQTLLADGLAAVAIPLSPPLALGLYLGGGPIIHIVHLNGFKVLMSLGVRVIAPVTGALIGGFASEGCDGFLCQLEGAAVGTIVGVGIAVVTDAALVSHEKVPAEKKSATLVPIILPGRIGLAGTF